MLKLKTTVSVIIGFLFFSILALGGTAPLYGETTAKEKSETTVKLKSKIEAVTVYADRARITRSAVQHLPAGTHRLEFGLLSLDIDKDSIAVDGRGPAMLTDVRIEEEKFEKIQDQKIKALVELQEQLEEQEVALADKIDVSKEQLDFIKKIAGKVTMQSKETATLEPDKWAKMVDFHRSRMASLKKEIRATEKEEKKLEKKKEKVDWEIGQLEKETERMKYRVTASVHMKKAGKLDMKLSYVIEGPYWFPHYEFRVDSAKKTVGLRYFGEVRQNTDEDWENVRITLSTAKPDLGSTHGDMKAVYVGYLPETEPGTFQSIVLLSASLNNEKEFDAGDGQKYSFDGASASENTYRVDDVDTGSFFKGPYKAMTLGRQGVQNAPTSALFEINDRHWVKRGEKGLRITLMDETLPVNMRYSAIPKLSAFAYLKAKVVNSTSYPLLEGEGNVFLDQAFVTRSEIPYAAPKDDFWLFLGADRDIKVEYIKTPAFSDRKGILKKKQNLLHKRLIKIKNKKPQKIELVVFDQVPVAKNDDIKVKLIRPKRNSKSKGQTIHFNNLGGIEWVFHPEPGEEIQIPLEYSLQYPLGKQVEILSK